MAEERSQVCFRDKRKTGDCSSMHTHTHTQHTWLARFPSEKWSNLWGPKIRRNIRHLAFFFTDPGLPLLWTEKLERDKETKIYAGQLKSGDLLSWTYWQGMVDNVFMLILSVVWLGEIYFFREEKLRLSLEGSTLKIYPFLLFSPILEWNEGIEKNSSNIFLICFDGFD